jgi:hypothetical protein
MNGIDACPAFLICCRKALLTAMAVLPLTAGAPATSWAQPAASSPFNINIRLFASDLPATRGFCISRELSELTQALVTVTCDQGQFVRIEPAPGVRHRTAHGGAFRYALLAGGSSGVPGGSGMSTLDDARAAAGTVTSLRVLRNGHDADVLEMWIYF